MTRLFLLVFVAVRLRARLLLGFVVPFPVPSEVVFVVSSSGVNLWLLDLLGEFFHGCLVFDLEVFSDLFKDGDERVSPAVVLFGGGVHSFDKFNERVLQFFLRRSRKNHHHKILHQALPIVKFLLGTDLVVDQPGIIKPVEPSKVHRHLVVEPHQLRGILEVLMALAVVQHLNEALHQFAIDIHGVFVEPVVEIVSELFVLRFPVGRVGQVVFVEGVLEDVLRLHDVHRP